MDAGIKWFGICPTHVHDIQSLSIYSSVFLQYEDELIEYAGNQALNRLVQVFPEVDHKRVLPH